MRNSRMATNAHDGGLTRGPLFSILDKMKRLFVHSRRWTKFTKGHQGSASRTRKCEVQGAKIRIKHGGSYHGTPYYRFRNSVQQGVPHASAAEWISKSS